MKIPNHNQFDKGIAFMFILIQRSGCLKKRHQVRKRGVAGSISGQNASWRYVID